MGFTPLCPTWAALDSDRLDEFLTLDSTRGMSQRGEMRGSDRDGMNLIVIEEHQFGDLVFAQVYYLYILLEATLAYVIVPITKVP